jgi:germination protein M
VLRRALVLAALPLTVAACGLSRESATTTAPSQTTTATTAPVSPAPTSVVVYFLRDGKVAPVRIRVPHTRAVATAALHALFAGPPEGYESAVGEGTKLDALAIDAGVAQPSIVGSLDESARAQVVYTLTRFPTVTGVALPGAGEPLTRDDFEAQTPRILIEAPLPGDTVTSPIRVTGTANTFEASFELQLVQGERLLAVTHATATSGTGIRGTFSETLTCNTESGAATIVAYEPNAGEGPPQLGRVEIPVTLG